MRRALPLTRRARWVGSALRQLPQLRQAHLSTCSPLASWERELPLMQQLTDLCVWDWLAGKQQVDEAVARRVLARLPSMRRLRLPGALAADVERRLRHDFPRIEFRRR